MHMALEWYEHWLNDNWLPTRIVTQINPLLATTPDLARHLIPRLSVILIRDDLWTLGAIEAHANAAEELWRGSWIAKVDRQAGTLALFDDP